MRVGAKPENVLEWVLLRTLNIPTPIMDTMSSMLLARTIMVATKTGVFEALEGDSLTVKELAEKNGLDEVATKKLLDALVGCRYLRYEGERYSLTPVVRKWLLKSSPVSLYDQMLFRFIEWDMLSYYEQYIRTGKPFSDDDFFSLGERDREEFWNLYQKGMRSYTNMAASEMARRTPIPKGARDMIDIGGAHGYNSVIYCRHYPELRSVVLDLPEAVEKSAPILAEEGMGDRVVHRVGNALEDDLGTEEWDVVYIAQVVHHFSDETNRELARRVAKSLRPGGVYIIQEVIRPSLPTEFGQPGALLDLFFGSSSQSGTWTYEEMADWQRGAGLVTKKPIRFRSVPGCGQQVAVKPEK